jgi:A1 cistron-splicing factor AAR2
LIDVLQFQLDECPEDFFRDILSENNFTSVMLKVGFFLKKKIQELI